MLWFLWVCCCTMQKLKGKSNSVDIQTGHPVFAKKSQFWWFLQNGLPSWKLLWVEQSLTAADMPSKDTSGQCLQWALQGSLQSSNSAARGLVALSRSLWCCVSPLQKSSAMAWKNVKRKRPIVWRFLECLKASMLVWDAGDVMRSLLVCLSLHAVVAATVVAAAIIRALLVATSSLRYKQVSKSASSFCYQPLTRFPQWWWEGHDFPAMRDNSFSSQKAVTKTHDSSPIFLTSWMV